MGIQELEVKMWNAAQNRDAEVFLQVVDKDAIMVCGASVAVAQNTQRLLKNLMSPSILFRIMRSLQSASRFVRFIM